MPNEEMLQISKYAWIVLIVAVAILIVYYNLHNVAVAVIGSIVWVIVSGIVGYFLFNWLESQ